MFLTRMVSGFICSKNSSKNVNNSNNSSHQQQQPSASSTQQQQQHSCQQPPAKSPKSNKKSEKCKRALSKTDSKKSLTELIKSQAKELPAKEAPSTSKATLKPPTKVKSGSWKRSEKQISSYNSISGKKSKSLRKRSPTWLKFPNSPVKIADKVSPVDSTSVCRPGTLYSDVLFGAGSSCLVKIKTLTPRRNNNTAQKKLTKALLKCAGGTENEASGSETETDRELFPSLNEYSKSPNTVENAKTPTPPSTTPTTARSDDEADVVILSEMNGVQSTENGFSDISYGSYLEQHFKQLNNTINKAATLTTATTTTPMSTTSAAVAAIPQLSQKCPSGKPFTVDIPQWNFLDADISSDAAYPKFLCQFEDEHYLKAEKMALLGLKLALGNNTQQAKFKF